MTEQSIDFAHLQQLQIVHLLERVDSLNARRVEHLWNVIHEISQSRYCRKTVFYFSLPVAANGCPILKLPPQLFHFFMSGTPNFSFKPK